MKKFLSGILIFVLCLTMVACGSSDEPQQPSVNGGENSGNNGTSSVQKAEGPLLYKVTDSSGNVAWLFGSIHVGREDYYPLPDYVQNAFKEADSLAVEADMVAFESDQTAQTKALMQLVYRDGTKISDHIPQELYNKCVNILTAENTYMPMLDMYSASFWSSTIQSMATSKLGGDAKLGIDRHFLNLAKESGKTVLEIESAELQYSLMAGFSDELQCLTLESAVEQYENPEEARKDLKSMMDLWASGDEQAFADFLANDDQNMTADEKEIYKEYKQIMITDRNLSMADWAENALSSGDEVFIVVGAAHVIGEGALADLLTQRGYTVERIAG